MGSWANNRGAEIIAVICGSSHHSSWWKAFMLLITG